ncbi:unnamed protein product, partial [Rotaria sp. Silwood1]
MLDECRRHYSTDDVELTKIDEFEKIYTSEDAIKYYTQNGFLYRVLNAALRTQDIEVIFQFRFFINDLHNQLRNLQYTGLDQTLTLYRGQYMTYDEFEKLQQNVGKLFSFNAFLSATWDKNVALIYAGNGCEQLGKQSVLFQIVVDDKERATPFADISSYSFFKDEEEVLFSLRAAFRVEAVEKFNHRIWLVTIALKTPPDFQNNGMSHFLHVFCDHKIPLERLATILAYMGEHTKAERFIKTLLTELSVDDFRISNVYYFLAMIAHNNNNYSRCVEYQMTAQNYIESKLHSGQSDQVQTVMLDNLKIGMALLHDYSHVLAVASIQCRIAEIFRCQGNKLASVSHSKEAIKLCEKAGIPPTNPIFSRVLELIGKTWIKLKEYELAIDY